MFHGHCYDSFLDGAFSGSFLVLIPRKSEALNHFSQFRNGLWGTPPACTQKPIVATTSDFINVPICCAPLPVESGPYEGMNYHFRQSPCHQTRDITAPFVNLRFSAPLVRVTLAGTDDGCLSHFSKYLSRASRRWLGPVNINMRKADSRNLSAIRSPRTSQRFSHSRLLVIIVGSRSPCR